MAYQVNGIITADVDVPNQAQNGPERLFEILEEAVVKPDEALLMSEEELKHTQELVDQAWNKVRRWFWANDDEDVRATAAYVRGTGEVTPLHLMCKLQDPPSDLVHELVESAPEVAGFADSYGWLPLHHACANGASTEVLQILINAYPESKLIQDNQNRTPLHFYATRNTDLQLAMTRNVRILCDTGAAELADRGGMLPMHYACAYGSSAEVLKVLAEAFPESLTTRENKGKTPMHLTMVNAHRASSPGVLNFLCNTAGKETVDLRDTEGNLPLHLLNLGVRGVDLDSDQEKLHHTSECLKIYLAAKPKPSADFLAEIQNLPSELQDVAVISPHVRDLLNKKIVRRFPTAVILMDINAYILLIACFEVSSSYHISARFKVEEGGILEEETPWQRVTRFVVLAASGYLLLREFMQLMSIIALGLGIGSWVNDLANWLDVVIFVVPATFGIMMLEHNQYVTAQQEQDTNPGFLGMDAASFRGGCALVKFLLWGALVFYLKTLSINFAVFIDGLFFVLKRLVAFMIAVACILVAFAMMFYILYQKEEICEPEMIYESLRNGTDTFSADVCDNGDFPHCDPWYSMLKVYTMMMGEIGNETRYQGVLAAQIIYIFYAFVVVILLSNVLIAIVTDSYEFIQNDRAAIVFWSNRLDLVAEMDVIISLVMQRLFCSSSKSKGAVGAPTRVQERPGGTTILDDGADDDGLQEGLSRNIWISITEKIFDEEYENTNMASLEFWIAMVYQVVVFAIVLPLWLVIGLISFGVLWPPQVREYLLLQGEGGESQQSRERQKLEQLKDIQDDIALLKTDIQKEIAADRSDMARMKHDVENVQNEVLSDLQQIKELMSTLLDLGGMDMDDM